MRRDACDRYDGHALMDEVYALVQRRLPAVPPDDAFRPAISAFMTQLGPFLGRDRLEAISTESQRAAVPTADDQWQHAWTIVAEACETALTSLDARHPRRAVLLAVTRDARECAQLRPEPGLRTVPDRRA